MRGSQAVEVAAGWACIHSRDDILKFPWKYSQSLSCVGVVKNVRLPLKLTFQIDCLWLQPSAPLKPFQCSPERPCFGPEINCYMGHCVQANREYDTTKNWSTSADQIIWEHWDLQSCNPHDVLRANMPLPLDFPIVQWGGYFRMNFIAILTRWQLCRNSSNVKDGLQTWRFTTFRSETRLEGQHGRRNCQYSRWYAGEIKANTRNRFIQCMDNGGRHLPDVIFKTV